MQDWLKMSSTPNNVILVNEGKESEESFNPHNVNIPSPQELFWTTMMSQIESCLACNSLHNTKTSQKELKIILWRLLWAYFMYCIYTCLSDLINYLFSILALAGIWTQDLAYTKPICYQLSYPGQVLDVKINLKHLLSVVLRISWWQYESLLLHTWMWLFYKCPRTTQMRQYSRSCCKSYFCYTCNHYHKVPLM